MNAKAKEEDIQTTVCMIKSEIDSTTSPDDATAAPLLDHLALSLSRLFNQNRNRLDVLDEAVDVATRAVTIAPEGHPNRCTFLGYLGMALKARADIDRDVPGLEEEVSVNRAALNLFKDGSGDWLGSSINLGKKLQALSEWTRNTKALRGD
ncbi:hypothetical protein AJ80_03557 [Polytolypa hystricis UAMH7299]|uniref:Uncharacterized protein n=1 Tax=Polytolypa hystricis (strain UAMH7299) TaxID=1447883 RepID=A0A2B7YHR9_POLH7|nr:hypothetical protein AJ80_03557 [Polytolypa hystricis UAMH7299]